MAIWSGEDGGGSVKEEEERDQRVSCRARTNREGEDGRQPTLYPFPISPMRFLPGTTTSSKSRVQVELARMPSCERKWSEMRRGGSQRSLSSLRPPDNGRSEGKYADLLLLLRNLNPHPLLDHEAGDPLVAERCVDGREDEEDVGFVRVRDPPAGPRTNQSSGSVGQRRD